jgi:hypothetical protein
MDDKTMGEEDLKGLEEEIDDAVDRLFVEKKKGGMESFVMETPLVETPPKSPSLEPPVKPFSLESSLFEPSVEPTPSEPLLESSLLEPSYELKKDFDLESLPKPSSIPVPFLKSIEKMEAQLLSLEWEITDEKLKKTREETLALRELLKQKADLVSILSDMEKVLSHMIENEENIRPAWVKFLLDAKETIKLLMRKETEGEINIYKQLAYVGIEARFSSLEGMKESKIIQPSLSPGEGVEKGEIAISGEKKIEDLSNKMNLFMEKGEEIFGTMKQQISRLEEMIRTPPTPPTPSLDGRARPVSVTIFKVDVKLFGVESQKVFKLFKVPHTFREKYLNQQKIRLRDFEVKMINLKKILSIPGGQHTGETRILTVKDNGEYKGLIVDQVLKKLSTLSEKGGEMGEYFSGVIHSIYQEQPVAIPILDLRKF